MRASPPSRRARAALLVLLALAALLVAGGADCGAAPAGDAAKTRFDVARAVAACRRGAERIAARDPDGAETAFREALRYAPGFPDPLVGLGHAAALRGDDAAALARYQEAKAAYVALAKQQEDDRAAQFHKTQIAAMGTKDQIQELKDAAGKVIGPSNDIYISHLENVADDARRMEKPGRPLPATPPPEFDFWIGAALYRLGRVDEARESWEAAVAARPDFGAAWSNLAAARLRLGRCEEARAALARADAAKAKVPAPLRRDVAACTPK